jgi:hypothetical protein
MASRWASAGPAVEVGHGVAIKHDKIGRDYLALILSYKESTHLPREYLKKLFVVRLLGMRGDTLAALRSR